MHKSARIFTLMVAMNTLLSALKALSLYGITCQPNISSKFLTPKLPTYAPLTKPHHRNSRYQPASFFRLITTNQNCSAKKSKA